MEATVANTQDMAGRVVLITGAGALPGRGMGRAISQALGRRGAAIVAVDIDPLAAAETAAQLEDEGISSLALEADVTDPSAIRRVKEAALAEFGKVDVLINHAGFGAYNSLTETDDALWDRMLALNLTGPFLMSREFMPHMLERGSGVIICTVSAAGLAGGRAGIGYTAAKHGLVGLIKNIAFVYGSRGIRCVGVAPGYTRSGNAPQIATSDSETAQLLDAVVAAGPRQGTPQELAEAFAFLASDQASYINGTILPVDGGWTAI